MHRNKWHSVNVLKGKTIEMSLNALSSKMHKMYKNIILKENTSV